MRNEDRVKLIYAALEAGVNTFEIRGRDPQVAIAVGEEAETLEEVHEPFLIQEGYLARTAQGRILTAKGYGANGLKAATGDQQSLL